MKKMLFGMTLFFAGLFGVIGFLIVASLNPDKWIGSGMNSMSRGSDLNGVLEGTGLMVPIIVAWIFLFVGLFLCIYEAYTREANERQRAQEAQTDGDV